MTKEMTEYYKKKLEEGMWYQDFVQKKLYKLGLSIVSYSSKKYQHLHGENLAGIEIKYDQKTKETNNIYIEIAEKTHPENKEFIPSGIYANPKTWLYLIGDKSEIFIFAKKFLIVWHRKELFKEVKISTSKGFLIPAQQARKRFAIRVIEVNNSQHSLFGEG